MVSSHCNMLLKETGNTVVNMILSQRHKLRSTNSIFILEENQISKISRAISNIKDLKQLLKFYDELSILSNILSYITFHQLVRSRCKIGSV